MQNEFITYEQALALKELGFDESCVYYVDKDNNSYIYNFETNPDEFIEWCGVNVIPAPLYQQAFRWFREKHKLYPQIGLHDREDEETWRFTISILGYYELVYNQNVGKEPYHKTYEEAEQACLDKLIEIIKTKTNEQAN